MLLALSHQSALEYWRVHPDLSSSNKQIRTRASVPSVWPTPENLAALGTSLPMHILLRNPGLRRPSESIIPHIFTSRTPIGCFVQIDSKLSVSSPEFCFLQLAGQLALPKLIELGYELCGTYSLPHEIAQEQTGRGFADRPPLTSKHRLEAFIASMPGVRGYRKAKQALHYIQNNSASPMETKLCILLVLPNRYGGYGIPLPLLNKRIDPSKAIRRSANRSKYFCDLFWPDFDLAVEYESNAYHSSPEQIASDSKRRNTLVTQGITVITVTSQQIHDILEFDKVATQIARNMQRRFWFTNPEFAKLRFKLRTQILFDQASLGRKV